MNYTFEEMLNHTMESVVNNDDTVVFTSTDGTVFEFYHSQGCCESVYVEDVAGDLNDLVGSPILMAEEVSDDGKTLPEVTSDSHTWTFYKFATEKGYVTIRWLGVSNGYYSESVHFRVLSSNKQEEE